jgi:hypothetical protein
LINNHPVEMKRHQPGRVAGCPLDLGAGVAGQREMSLEHFAELDRLCSSVG